MDSMTYKINGMDRFHGVQNQRAATWSIVSPLPLHGFRQQLPRFLERAAEERCTQALPTAAAGVVDDDDLMERDLLSRVTGEDTGGHRLLQDPMPLPPSPTLSLLVGTEEERQGPAANVVVLLPSSSRVHLAPDGRRQPQPASVVEPGCPMSERRHNLRAGGAAGARAQAATGRAPVQEQRARASPAAGPGPAPQRPPTARTLGLEERCCDACGVSARLLRCLSSDLDRARAQVALLTCQNESLRHRLKHASASEGAGPAASSSAAARLSLRCVACRVRPATVQLVPREHLCLCGRCSKAGVACPVCRGAVGAWLTEAAPRSGDIHTG